MHTERVLGISLGTRKIGVAILERHAIYDWQMKVFNQAWCKEKFDQIINVIVRYCSDYNIRNVGVKIPTAKVNCQNISELINALGDLGKQRELNIYFYSIFELKKFWLSSNVKNKRNLMISILEKYPDLKSEYEKEMKNKSKHYEKLFEAVGVAEIVLRKVI